MKAPAVRYSPDIADAILSRLANGERLSRICAEPGMPHRDTVHTWAIDDVDGFSARYDRARLIGGDCMADDIVDLSDKATAENAQAVRLQVDSRKWYLAKYFPRRFGDRLEIGTAPGGALAPINISFNMIARNEEPAAIEGDAVRLPSPDQSEPSA